MLPSRRRAPSSFLPLATTLLLLTGPSSAQEEERLPRKDLEADVRALVGHLEEAHPDPYLRGGGRIAFHRRVFETIDSLPQEGMTRDEFYEHLLPLVASVRDGHTRLHAPRRETDEPGLPLAWRVIDTSLYVAAVFDPAHEELLGGRLASLAGVPFQELVARQGRRAGYDNEYDNLRHLRRTLAIRHELSRLLPEWSVGGTLSVEVELPPKGGASRSTRIDVPLQEADTSAAIPFPSRIELPSTDASDPSYAFLDPDRKIALLRSDSMMSYREAFESWYDSGNWGPSRVRAATRLYEATHDGPAPENVEELIAGIPSATETFLSLFREMKEASTHTLLVDLRRNQGGNSLISWILAYVLLGPRATLEANADSYQIRRYSQLYYDNNTNRSIEDLRERLGIPLEVGDYNFLGQREHEAWQAGSVEISDEDLGSFERVLGKLPSCKVLFESDEYAAMYRPENVVLLSSGVTYSAGFDLLVDLYKAGAILVGTPSAQTGNCFIDSLRFELPRSGLTGNLSCKYRELFPGDPERGEVLRPHHALTYGKLVEYEFDPNAEVLLALEALGLAPPGHSAQIPGSRP